MNNPNYRANVPIFAAVDRWCDLSGMGRTKTYEALARGDLTAKKVCGRTLIDVGRGLDWLEQQPDATFEREARQAPKADAAAVSP